MRIHEAWIGSKDNSYDIKVEVKFTVPEGVSLPLHITPANLLNKMKRVINNSNPLSTDMSYDYIIYDMSTWWLKNK